VRLRRPVAKERLTEEVGGLARRVLADDGVRQGAVAAIRDVAWRCSSWPAGALAVSGVVACVSFAR
jgi:hypothetical protein